MKHYTRWCSANASTYYLHCSGKRYGSPNVQYSDVQGGFPGSGNINVDPQFLGYPKESGTWSAAATYNPTTFQSTLTNSTKSWAPSSLKGLYVRPRSNGTGFYEAFLIVDNTATTIKVWSDVTWLVGGPPLPTYQIFNFHIGAASPCTNTGASGGVPYDLDGNPRPSPVGGNWDMGAFEYQWP